VIDANPKMMVGIKRYQKGEIEEWLKTQDVFLKELEQSTQDHCPCKTQCKLHGECKKCVSVHRAHRDHLPVCLHSMVNERLNTVSGLTEHSLVKPE
jgi:hypothetical protein